MFTAYSAGYRLVIHQKKAETYIRFFQDGGKGTVIDQYLTFAIFSTLSHYHYPYFSLATTFSLISH
jgi:hypothetical protein